MTTEILYAMTAEGVSLPIIDVTHPRFAVKLSDAKIESLLEDFENQEELRSEMPPSFREALQRSILGKALMAAKGTYLSGMGIYRMKLGPDNQRADAYPVDRSIAASFPALMARVRLQDIARLLADGLSRCATATTPRPICLINIGGGPASDSWNALLSLRAGHPDLLKGRTIVIAVLDLDDQGPTFGERALEVLCAPDAPLCGLNVDFQFRKNDWSQTNSLQKLLSELRVIDMTCAVSSEGGLFEYGSDLDIVSNLMTLHSGTAPETFVVGSVTRADARFGSSQGNIELATKPRSLNVFQTLVEEAGWRIQTVAERPFTYNLRLAKA